MEERDYLYLDKGTILNQNYIINSVLVDRSNFSIVYKGQDKNTNNDVVIKEFFPKNMALRDMDKKNVVCRNNCFLQRFDEEIKRFLVEGNIMKEVEGEHSAKCHDTFMENGTAYIIMKHHEGGSLEDYINENLIGDWGIFLDKIMYPIMNAVNRVHEKGYLHRDIKPSNIIMEKEKMPILIDFGSAINWEVEKEKKIMVTPGFSPIEFYSEDSRQGKASDVYSAAAMLYYYFAGETPPEATKRIIEDDIQNLSTFNKNVPYHIEKVIMKNLSMKMEKRDTCMKQLKKSLKRAVKIERIKARYKISRLLLK